ncbi:MAG: PQQ-binding-like beta-propeller repeat protein [Planctomycetota bacterium]|nr:PQQ-binding-like beta-propeller repeat protein [Planctomycetota bacterium]
MGEVGWVYLQRAVARLCLCIMLITVVSGAAFGENWPAWRGPRGDGTSLEKNVPVKWSAIQNIVWKVPIPGKGHASPIVWGDRIFVVTAVEDQDQRVLLCLDRTNGKVIWRRVVLETPFEKLHALNSRASSTPATDGEKVYVSFLDRDKMFVAAYDFDGNEVWSVRPGVFSSRHGYCSSPVLWKDKVLVNGDHDGPAYLTALERDTGKTIWKTPRPNKTRSYCAPIVRHIDGRNQMILAGNLCVASYDPDTGKQHWIIDGPTEQYVASLVYNGDLLFLTCGFPDHFLQAIRPDGHGNVTRTHIAWQKDKDCSYVPSPIAIGPYFLVVSDTGVATCYEARSGKSQWRERLGPHFSASLVTANGLAYFLSDKGVMTIVKPGPKFEVVARSDIGEQMRASPAISEEQMFLRGTKNLYCISK